MEAEVVEAEVLGAEAEAIEVLGAEAIELMEVIEVMVVLHGVEDGLI